MIEYFKDLSKKEITNFKAFVNSPYHNSNRQVIRMFNYLRSKYPDIQEPDLDKAVIYKHLFPDKSYNDDYVRKLISDFTKVFENFLIQTEYETEVQLNNTMLLRSLRKRGIKKRFESILNDSLKLQKKQFSRNEMYYSNQINLENEYYHFNFDKFKFAFAKCLQSKSDNIDLNFIFQKLHVFNEMLNNEYNTGKTFPFKKTFLDDILGFIEENKKIIKASHPNMYIIYLQLMMFMYLKKDYMEEMKSYLMKNEKKFISSGKSVLPYYYNYLVAFCLRKINIGETQYRNELFSLYDKMLSKDLFLIDKIINDYDFTSVVNNVLAINKYDWVETFIEKYKKFIEPAFAKDSYNLAKAKIYFYKKEFEKVFPYLNSIVYKNPNYYFNSKFLLVRVYLETGNIREAKYIIDNLKQYIREKYILTEEQITIIKTFNKYAIELIKICQCTDKDKKALTLIFRKELDNEKNFVPNKAWFYNMTEANKL
ncbi:MAG: hypothetical protein JST15_01375 [Bacteroidetes bacterium]|nr:hypothetical protein [Bacteroidota bacterium]